MEPILQLKRDRGLILDNLNTVCTNIENLLISPENINIIKEEIVKLDSVFKSLSLAHSALIEQSEATDISSFITQFESVETNYNELKKRVSEWLISATCRDTQSVKSGFSRVSGASKLSRRSRLSEAHSERRKSELRLRQLHEEHELMREQERLEAEQRNLSRNRELLEAQNALARAQLEQEIAAETEYERAQSEIEQAHQRGGYDHAPDDVAHAPETIAILSDPREYALPPSASAANVYPIASAHAHIRANERRTSNVNPVAPEVSYNAAEQQRRSSQISDTAEMSNTVVRMRTHAAGCPPGVPEMTANIPEMSANARELPPGTRNVNNSAAEANASYVGGRPEVNNVRHHNAPVQNTHYAPMHGDYGFSRQNFANAAGPTYPGRHDVPSQNELMNDFSTVSVFNRFSDVLQASINLPKPEIMHFSGNVIEFPSFIYNFESNIVARVHDNNLRLSYLIQFCSGEPKELIENCVLLGEHGYARARELLGSRFGRPHIIARAHIDRLIKGEKIKAYDPKGLKRLSLEMSRAELSLVRLGFQSEIDNSENLRRIIDRLPTYIETKWIEKAYLIVESGRSVKFSDLCKFIEHQANVANSMFGLDYVNKSKVKVNKGPKPQPQQRGQTASKQGKQGSYSFATAMEQEKPKVCRCCGGSCKRLEDCSKFKDLPAGDRASYVRKNRLCNNCFIYNHIAKDCRKEGKCSVSGCNKKHHTLLHAWFASKQQPAPESPEKTGSNADSSDATCTATSFKKQQRVCLRVLPVTVTNGNKSVDVYAMLDDGSTATLCDNRLISELDLAGEQREFTIKTVNGTTTASSTELDITVSPIDGSDSVDLKGVRSVAQLPISLDCVPKQVDLSRWDHLSDLRLPEIDSNRIMLLIGSDTPEVFWSLEERRGSRGDPYAVRSILGWTVLGPMSKGQNKHACVNFVNSVDQSLETELQRMWTTEFADTSIQGKSISQDDRKALEIMEKSTELIDGHYQLALPWRAEEVNMPDNRAMAQKRLSFLKKKLLKDPDLHAKYVTQIESYIAEGYASKVTESCVQTSGTKIWYLPHHAVVNDNKPGKVRVVFDCAAKYAGTSLNDQLLQGPDLANSMIGVLLRFRQEHIALSADIEAMFHQVRVQPDDRDALRFLWWRDGDPNNAVETFRMNVHLFGATSSPSCTTFCLQKTATDNSQFFKEETVNTVLRDFYVDDLLKSVPTESEGIALTAELQNILSKGGFRLTKWRSSSRNVLASVPENDRAPEVSLNLVDHNKAVQRALGVHWNLERDTITFVVNNRERPFTRRGILSAVASFFDPLGLVAPITLNAKQLLQKLCKLKKEWDDPISEEDANAWTEWLEELTHLQNLHIPRCYKPKGFDASARIELHLFSDASESGYGCCAYLRYVKDAQPVHTALVFGKSRLTPIKAVTIPRLELTAAVLACRMSEVLRRELDLHIEQTMFWTDSMIVIGYIHNTTRRFKTFVANRISSILDMSKPEQWRHVPTALNPADLASRGISATDSSSLSVWLQGPEFLRQSEDSWPPQRSSKIEPADPELKKEEVFINPIEADTVPAISHLFEKISSWPKLQRIIAWVLRIRYRSSKDYLEIDELKRSTRTIVQVIQSQVFQSELVSLKKNGHVSKSSKFIGLSPQLADGLLVVGGRIKNSSFSSDVMHQIILPERHQVTDMLIRHYHQMFGHVGPLHVLSRIRQTYWIINGLKACKSVISKCVVCRRQRQRPMQQQMGDLPKERVTPDKPPFSYVGVDYFGPFMVNVKRSKCKRYGCLFTCLASRAIHIEIAHSLDQDSFLAAMTRFISRRGRPLKVYSDNGTNLRSGERELRELVHAWNGRQVHDSMMQHEIQWTFNPPHSSHMGGVWERLVRSVRDILTRIARSQPMNDETLLTFMAEAERIVNSRPITQVTADVRDPLPLSPAQLLVMREGESLPYGTFTKEDNFVQRWWKQAQYLANIFWRRWVREYLPSLQIRSKWQRSHRNAKPNDLVLMQDENLPRGRWPLGVVTEVNTGRDGLVRSCKVRSGGSEYVRPIHKLCLLELSD